MMFTLSLTLASNLLLAPPTEEEIKTKIDAAMAFFREKVMTSPWKILSSTPCSMPSLKASIPPNAIWPPCRP